jgi:hypothetical protein
MKGLSSFVSSSEVEMLGASIHRESHMVNIIKDGNNYTKLLQVKKEKLVKLGPYRSSTKILRS